MRIGRWIIAALVLVYALQNLLLAVYLTSLKFGWTHIGADTIRFAPLVHATSVVQIAAWWVALSLMGVATWRLVRNKPALIVFSVAIVLSVATWLSLKLAQGYTRAFDAGEQRFDYVLLALLVVLGASIWIIERNETRQTGV
ncbi:MAG: hypothetical protein ABSD74_04725 [Rhizomicrobium sp.]|jgi:hypothetical protein